jgi:hypothetical protein
MDAQVILVVSSPGYLPRLAVEVMVVLRSMRVLSWFENID